MDLAGVVAQLVVLDPALLAADARSAAFAQSDGHVRASGHGEQLGQQLGPIFGLAATRGGEFQVELRALEEHRQGPGVVDVVADVGVKDHRDLGHRRRGRQGHRQAESHEQEHHGR